MPSSFPLVTLVTPSFNQGRFIRRTIESVLNQSYPHIEYLVLDGGSRDESLDILASYGSRFSWVSEKDRGQAHAINKGLSQAKGEIFAYLNSDDVILPHAVEIAVRHFQENSDWDLIYGAAEYIDEVDQSLGPYPTHDYSWPRLMQYCYLCQPATFWRASIARKVGAFNETLHCCLDYEYWLRVARTGGKLVRVPELLAQSRIYPSTKTLALREKVYGETIRIQQDLVGFVELGPFYGLWRHRCKENKQGWAGKLGWLPLTSPTLATLHYLWHNAGQAYPWRTLGGLWRGLKRMVGPRQSKVG